MRIHRHPRLAVGLALVVAAAGGWAVWRATADGPPATTAGADPVPEPPPPDPRLTFPTPFRNVKPEVRYVGDAACSGCHADIDKTYRHHPMGRSAELVGRGPPLERYDPSAHNPTVASGYTLRAEPAAGRVVHRMSFEVPGGPRLPDYTLAADLAIGSGTRGRSYVALEQGAAWQSPYSWYAQDGGRWDVSPGFDLGTGGRRAVIPECLFCHVDRVEPVPGARNRYEEPVFPGQVAIGCERCHGPGELHAAERAAGAAPAGADTSIVNPKHLSPELRAAVCEQCHLQGQERVVRRGRDVWEFRPGLPFELFVSVYVRHPDIAEARRSVGQFEQMEQSRCFLASQGRLGCTSCHDPHAVPPPEAKPAFYRAKCQTCHEQKGCTAPAADRQARADSCVACHMPRSDSANIVHASVTDHRVPRRPLPPDRKPPALDGLPLLPFRVGPHAPPEAERERDYGVVLGRVAGNLPPAAPTRGTLADAAAYRLTASLRRWPDDDEGWLALAAARQVRGDADGRFRAAEAAARAAPGSELALADLADAALKAGRLDAAEAAAGELIRLSPTDVTPRVTRASVYVQRGEWAKAEAACREALAVHPLYSQARIYLALCRHRLGDPAGGRAEARAAAALIPRQAQQQALIDWYDRETRGGR
jgi:hypothetical protein